MRWKHFPISENDLGAKKHVLENVSMGAMEHTLSKKLLARFSSMTGPFVLVAFDFLDIERVRDYAYGTYSGGKDLHSAMGGQRIPQEHAPIGGLIAIVQEHLRTSQDAIVLCENWIATRTSLAKRQAKWGPLESRVLLYGEEVYHILTSADVDYDQIECTIRESRRHWATGVCCHAVNLPHDEISSEAFFDDIVLNATKIFVPALDQEGYLVWSPKMLSL